MEKQTPVKSFISYFETQWLRVRYRHWQAIHSPQGYATTIRAKFSIHNETFFPASALLLLLKLMELIGITFPRPPMTKDYVAVPANDLKYAAKYMLGAKRVIVDEKATTDEHHVRVIHATSEDLFAEVGVESEDDDTFDAEFAEVFNSLNNDAENDIEAEAPTQADGTDLLTPHSQWSADISKEREKRHSCETLRWCRKVVDEEDHERGMPQGGWLVNLQRSTCPFRHYAKFRVCAHIL